MQRISPKNILTLLILLWTSKISPTTSNPVSFDNFTTDEVIRIIEDLKILKVYQRKALSFQKTELEEYVLGIAYDQYFDCYVELSPLLFDKSTSDYFKPVLYHEIGHCFGLDHSSNENDVMYDEARKESDYTLIDWERFSQQLKTCF